MEYYMRAHANDDPLYKVMGPSVYGYVQPTLR